MSNPTTPGTAPGTTPAAPKRRRRRMGCQIALLLVVVLTVAAFFICRRLWNTTPTYWTENKTFLNRHDNADLMDMAERAEKRLLAELTDAGLDNDAALGSTPATMPASIPSAEAGTLPGPGAAPGAGAGAVVPPDISAMVGTNLNQPRTLHVSTDEVNAWLAVKLETWAAYQNITLPPQIGGYMVTTEGQNFVFACQYNGQGISQVVSVVCHLDMLPDGKARLKIDSLRGGELPLPTGMALSQISRRVGKEAGGDEISRAVSLIDGKTFSPVHNIDAARQIRLLGYKLRPDGADITVETELRRGVKLPVNATTQP